MNWRYNRFLLYVIIWAFILLFLCICSIVKYWDILAATLSTAITQIVLGAFLIYVIFMLIRSVLR